jgi:hypothetical protein
MASDHLVRVGVLGWVGRFQATDPICFPRHADVIVCTDRGLEAGQVVTQLEQTAAAGSGAGTIVRRMTAADHLLAAKFDHGREAALAACATMLADEGSGAVLIDVEHLFDGRSLYFYYLGEVPPAIAAMTERLGRAYEAQVNLCKFTEVFQEGCGPGCGSQCGGASCGGCQAGCTLAGGCSVKNA